MLLLNLIAIDIQKKFYIFRYSSVLAESG